MSSGCSWVCTNQPGRTRAPSLALPVWVTGLISPSPTGWCSMSGSLPPAASRRRKWDLPEPLEPSTATRSPYQTSRSNGFMRPVSSRSVQTTARLPVRPPLSRIFTCCCRGCSVGGPFSSNLRSRVWAALYCEAMPSLYSALIR